MSKLGKKLAAWILVVAMILTTGNTTIFAQQADIEKENTATVSDSITDDATAGVSDSITVDATAGVSASSTGTSAKTYFEKQLKTALDSFSSGFSLSSSYGITVAEYKKMYSDYLYHHYSYFYVDPSAYAWSVTSAGYVTYVQITYELDGDKLDVSDTDVQEELLSKTEAIEVVLNSVATSVQSSWSDLEKALYIHDYLAKNCEYDLSYVKDTSYNALVEGTAVCEGYSLAYLALAEAIGLSCEIVSSDKVETGIANSGHMWNLVEVSGSWYHVDVTWDDPTFYGATANDAIGTDVIGSVSHSCFLKSTSYFNSTAISGTINGHITTDGSDYEYSGEVDTEDASSTKYDSCVWDDVDASFEYVDGTWYGLTRKAASGNSKKINAVISTYTYNSSNKSFQKQDDVFTVSQYWYIPGSTTSFVVGNFSYLASYDGLLYYNTNNTIYAYDPEEEETQVVYTLSDTEAAKGFIYGLCIDTDGNVKYLLATYNTKTGGIDRVGVYTALNVKNYIGNNYEIILSQTSYTYDGTAKRPDVTVVSTADSSVTLTKGTDYTVSYSNNTNAGTATVTVTGINSYAGALTAEFTIAKADRTVTLTNTATGANITGSSITMAYAEYLYIQASASAGDGTYSFSYSTANAVFTAKSASTGTCIVQAQAYSGSSVMTITIAETSNYNSASAKVTVTCTKRTQTLSVSSSSVSLTYAGDKIQLNPTHTSYASGGGAITYSSSNKSVAEVSSTGLITAAGKGTATITITAAETDTFAKAVVTVKVTVTTGLSKAKISSLTNATSGITVKWGKVTGATGYYIYRKASGGSYSLIKTITSGSTVSYTDSGVKSNSGKTYTYYVIPYYKSSSGTITKGTYSNTKSLLRLSSATVSSLTNTSTGITVKWGKVTGANGYYIYRKAGSGSYSLAKTITSGSTVSYTDTAVKSKNGTTYTYYVIPYYKNSSGTITKGSYANTKKTVRLTAVSLSSVTNSSSKKMTVKWAKNSSATGYEIQYSTSSSFSSGNKTVTVSGASSVSKVISSLTKGKTYYVRIRVYKTVSGTKYYSAWSSKKSVKISK